MKKYQSYKSSGVDWIGEIPEKWVVKKMKYFVKICNGSDYKDFVVDEGGFPVYGTGGVFSRCSKFLYDKPSVLLGRKGSVERPQFVNEPFWTSDTTYYTEIKENVSPMYFFHLVKQIQFDQYIYGSAIPSMTKSVYDEMLFPYPPLSEQLQIVQFLDEKTELIDKLISTKERKIDLLKQQRTSLINEVITKGLNPKVKMKDSGVEWIGEIPEHWEYKSLKYVVSCNDKVLTENTDPFYQLNYIEISDVDSSGNINNTTPYFFKDCPSRCRRILSKGDVMVSSVRTYLKSIGFIENDVNDLICSTGFCVLTPKDTILSKFLFYQVLTEYFIGEVISKSVGVSYPSITSTELTNIMILVPPKTEQQQIVEYLDTRTIEIDDLVSMEQKKIDLLKEYRQSLISEVITGKINVTIYE
jgi:type I restriction enzyme S subunit